MPVWVRDKERGRAKGQILGGGAAKSTVLTTAQLSRKRYVMGVRGLTTFMDATFTNWTKQKVEGHVVFDGSSLCHHLYFGVDWAHGGQYPEFREKVLEYFRRLQRSGVRPVVVLDGIDYTGEKNAVILRRRKEWVSHIHCTLANNRMRPHEAVGRVIPMLAMEVFQGALLEMHIPLYVADGEADYVIVQVANFYLCPVVSRDSDFFVFNVHAGYIPLDRFHWKQNPIVADIFDRRLFMQQFNLQDESLCYFIPAVAGNDFLPPYNIYKVTSGGTNRLLSLITFASKFSSLTCLLCEIPADDRKALQTSCTKAQQMYDVCTVQDPEELLTSTIFKLPNGADIPVWMLQQYRNGKLPLFVMESIVCGKSILRVAVEDAQLPSALASSKELRQHIYAILGRETVTEFYRHGLEITGETNRSESPRCTQIPEVSSLPSLRSEERAVLIYRFLKCYPQVLNKLEERWRLVAAATVFWACTCQPPQHLVKALILCVLLCSNSRGALVPVGRNSVLYQHKSSPKWMAFLHAYTQWQCIYFDAMTLSNLLMSPYPSFSPALLYDGKVAMSFAFARNIDQMVSSYPVDPTVYHKLVRTILQHTTMAGMPSESKPKQKDNHKAKRAGVHQRFESKFVHANPFALLEASDSEEDSSSGTTESD